MRPIVRRVLGHVRTTSLRNEDFEDIESTVNLRIFRKLELVRLYEEEAILSLDEFVATLTYNVVYDVLRRRFPERTRLKSRLRYLFTHDPRFALWATESGMICGLAAQRGREAIGLQRAVTKENASRAMIDRDAPAEAIAALFAQVGRPLPLEDVIDLVATLWDITDAGRPAERELAEREITPLDRIESRQYLQLLWKEIRELRGPQRAALLLNLRDDGGHNALAHLLAAGIATMPDIAAALEMPLTELAAIWNALPMGDAAVGELLFLTRQQVINLRKSARERLARRMKQP